MSDDTVEVLPPLKFDEVIVKPRPPTPHQRWLRKMADLLTADKMQVNVGEGQHQGYNTPADAKRAARRASRAVAKAAREGGKRPATHLQRKIALLVPIRNPKEKPDVI